VARLHSGIGTLSRRFARGEAGAVARELGIAHPRFASSWESVLSFLAHRNCTAAWNWHIASVLLLIGAFIPFDRLRRPAWRRAPDPPLALARPAVVAVSLATLARLWQLGEFPFGNWADEATNG